MIGPQPTALRLQTRARGVRLPAPPLGLRAWTPDAQAVAVLVDAAGVDVDDPAGVAAQIPHATELPAGTPVFILGEAVRGVRVLPWLWTRTVPVPRTARCAALIARGYVGVGASTDEEGGADLAWGVSSLC